MTETVFLKQIKGPSDIKNMNVPQLQQLAKDIRKKIIDVTSVTGGHLASNLGAVELSIALHKVFESPDDKFIFDVGHQAYTHKLLTGRVDDFETLWQYKGTCGFTQPMESPHDHFHAGHAGTAISLALGVAKNRDLTKRQEHIIPIIGDGTLTCGLTLEALNNIPHDLKKFIVILNDNSMSISKNVGAITQILSRLLNNPTANKIYNDLETLISKVPSYGEVLAKQSHKVTESLKHLVSEASFFEQYHLTYTGPIDGQDIKKLIETFEAVKNENKPVLIHLLTKKGYGLEAAERNPVSMHGIAPFDPKTGKVIKNGPSKPSFPKIFGKHLLKMAKTDPSLVAITPAMSKGSCLDAFMKEFPDRCYDVGIAEGHATTFAGGLAYGKKMKVVLAIYGTFLQRSLDNVFHDICLQELPVIIAVDRAGLASSYGTTHHSIYDISFLKAMPNMIIAQPRNGHILKELLESASSWEKPVAIRYPNLPTIDPDLPLKRRKPGRGEVIEEGKDILLIGLGHMIDTAIQVRKQLMEQGYQATVVDPIFIKPLDSDLFHKLLLSHDKVVTIEEHSVVGGLGEIMNHFLMQNGLTNAQVLNMGIPQRFVGHGSYKELIEELSLTPKAITERILEEFSLTALETNKVSAKK